MTKQFDLVVIGSGPAGYQVAIKANQMGLKVRLFEENEIGGVCLNSGCMPTKTLLRSANIYQLACKGSYFGIKATNVEFDYQRFVSRKDIVLKKLRMALTKNLKDQTLEVIKEKINLTEALKLGKKVIIATGTKPKNLIKTINTDQFLNLVDLPNVAEIIGAGVIGLELASLLNMLNVKVMVKEKETTVLARILPKDLAILAQDNLANQGIDFYLAQENNKQSEASENQFGKSISIACIGREFNSQEMQNDQLAINPNGSIKVDQDLKTNLDNVWAVGDINGLNMLAHSAYQQANVVINNLFNQDKIHFDPLVPLCIYSNPSIALVGNLNGERLITHNFSELGIAQAYGATDGFITISLINQKIKGIMIMGYLAEELIATATLIVKNNLTIDQLNNFIFAHPTFSEVFTLFA